MLKRSLLGIGFSFLLSLSAAAIAGEVTASDPYVRLPPPGTPNTGAFMTLVNNGTAAQKLVKAESQAAKTVELHGHVDDNGVMRMRPVKEIDIAPGGQAELKPGGYHVMFIDLNAPLAENDSVDIKLSFADGSTLDVKAPVRKIDVGSITTPAAKAQH